MENHGWLSSHDLFKTPIFWGHEVWSIEKRTNEAIQSANALIVFLHKTFPVEVELKRHQLVAKAEIIKVWNASSSMLNCAYPTSRSFLTSPALFLLERMHLTIIFVLVIEVVESEKHG